MKNFIEGKLYDTETSAKLCSKRSNTIYSHKTVSLYRTVSANFFSNTVEVSESGTKLGDSIKIVPIKEAKEFYAQNDGDVTKWKDVFGEEVERG